jgi:3-deoxy-7-phosphoheptulonate synthase
VHEVQQTEGATTPRHIDDVQEKFTEIVTGSNEFVVITGRCAQPVRLETSVNSLVQQRIQAAKICMRALKKQVYVMRRECDGKPRSADVQVLKNGESVTPFMGEGINGEALHQRTPDPSRMVSSAVQLGGISAGLQEAGYDIPIAREALLLPFEQASKRIDPETGKTYLVSADLPWVGERTRDPDGQHVELLADVENPVGVKLGKNTTSGQIRKYQEKLNPNNKPGKLVFMIRMELEEGDAMAETLAAIKEHAPNALLLYDIHGSTTTNEHGEKIRQVSKIIQGIHETAVACKKAGLKLHGIHLETTRNSIGVRQHTYSARLLLTRS